MNTLAFVLFYFLCSVHQALALGVCDIFEDSHRFDCDPDITASQTDCIARGCCWRPAANSSTPRRLKLDTPYCYFPSNFGGYEVIKESTTAESIDILLQLQGKGSHYGANIERLKVAITYDSNERVHVKITDDGNKRYEVPVEQFPSLHGTSKESTYEVSYTHFPFGFAVKRKSTGNVIFNTSISALLYADQFLQISSLLSSNNIYGLGEHVMDFKLKTDWSKLTLFSRDVATPQGGMNLYGVHPFYLNIENDGLANGVLLLNSNAMDIILQPTPAITYRTIGGILDFYIFVGSEPHTVIKSYQDLFGATTMPPYWALGFNLCRWGYGSVSGMKKVVERVRAAGIPHDVQWNDIDYMENHLDFTVDSIQFQDLPSYVDSLHDKGLRYVIIVDPGISNSQTSSYPPYTEGLEQDVFIKDDNNKPLIGKVWPGTTTYPDFFHPNASLYWTNQLSVFHEVLAFDGLWIDMNEPSNFVDGSTSGCPDSRFETPPYVPSIIDGSLKAKTICMTAKQYVSSHYNLHSLYGYSEGKQTMVALEKLRNKRSLVIGRSTFSGSGRYQGHWLGDNHSTWEDMKLSIAGILNFNIFGIPLVGADICGFMGDTTEELCARWMQLGAFYPFSRNHNTIGARDQDPGAFGDLLKTASRNALLTRYNLLPYLYTLFFNAHTEGGVVVQPLFFISPTDETALKVDNQFLWGSSLLISPVLYQGATDVNAYFPSGVWYDFYSCEAFLSNGTFRSLGASFDAVNLHVRGGSIIPLQKPSLTTIASRQNEFSLFVAPDASNSAVGQIYLDDGESLDLSTTKEYSIVNYQLTENILIASSVASGYSPKGELDTVTVCGVQIGPSVVIVNGIKTKTFVYNSETKNSSLTDCQCLFLSNGTVLQAETDNVWECKCRKGKSCIIKRYCEHRFNDKYNPTLGVDFGSVQVSVNNADIKIEVFDFSGDPLFYEVRNEFYRDAIAILLVFDVNNRQSLIALDAWRTEFMQNLTQPNITVMVCANKVDNYNSSIPMVKDGQQWAKNKGYLFFDVSALTGYNIDAMFKAFLPSSLDPNKTVAVGDSREHSNAAISDQLEAIKQLMHGQNNHERLGVGPNATRDEVIKAYRRLAVLLHPDKSKVKGTDEAFKRLVNAKTALLIDKLV